MEALRKTFLGLLKQVPDDFHRDMKINWNNRMIAITGTRGVGKTTYLLQKIKHFHTDLNQVLYASLDHLYFYEKSLIEVVDLFYAYGGRFLYLDEVHKYPDWSRNLKNLYDNYPELRIVFTSSSILDIYKGDADLSRRAIKYEMKGLSFREYLGMNCHLKFDQYHLEEIMFKQEKIFMEVPDGLNVLKAFRDYIEEGYYPISNEPDFMTKLQNIINIVIESDLAKIENLSQNKIEQVKKILGVIAESSPFKPNISSIANKTGISRDIILSVIYQLEKARIINLLHSANKGISRLQKPDKIFFENPNLMHALKDRPNIGNLRETFFMNQLKNAKHRVESGGKADFWVDRSYYVEIGGRNKTSGQIAELSNAFLVKDDIEAGGGSVIPLWMFGLLY